MRKVGPGAAYTWRPGLQEPGAASAMKLVTGSGRLLRLARGMAEGDLRVRTVDAGCAGVGRGFHGERPVPSAATLTDQSAPPANDGRQFQL